MWTFIRSGLWSLLTWVVDRTGANKFYRDQLVCTEQEPWLFRGGLLGEIQVPACRSLVCVFWCSCYLVWTIFVRETGNMGVRSEWLVVPVFVLVECKVDSKPLKPLTTVFCQLFHLSFVAFVPSSCKICWAVLRWSRGEPTATYIQYIKWSLEVRC